ncbi:MAG: pyridoxamine 5'-phosphate oxidase family protein [Chthoniobacter sp.]|nr:pyridoxamine 5'-phosphate oxidase family protein [Chthoniobacter sp.]
MNIAPGIDHECINLQERGDIIRQARSLLDGRHPGILATVNEAGVPALRWMSTLSFDEFPIYQTLTAPGSRKVAQIEQHPDVNWMFFNHNRSLILNLIGKAHVITETIALKRVWQKIQDKSHTYFLDHYATAPGFVVIETRIESTECIAPNSALRFAIELSDLAEAR